MSNGTQQLVQAVTSMIQSADMRLQSQPPPFSEKILVPFTTAMPLISLADKIKVPLPRRPTAAPKAPVTKMNGPTVLRRTAYIEELVLDGKRYPPMNQKELRFIFMLMDPKTVTLNAYKYTGRAGLTVVDALRFDTDWAVLPRYMNVDELTSALVEYMNHHRADAEYEHTVLEDFLQRSLQSQGSGRPMKGFITAKHIKYYHTETALNRFYDLARRYVANKQRAQNK